MILTKHLPSRLFDRLNILLTKTAPENCCRITWLNWKKDGGRSRLVSSNPASNNNPSLNTYGDILSSCALKERKKK